MITFVLLVACTGLGMGACFLFYRMESLRRMQSEGEQRFSTLFNSVREGIVQIDKTGIILKCNQSARQILGYSEEELVGKYLHQVAFHSSEQGLEIDEKEGILAACLQTQAPTGFSKVTAWRKSGSSFPIDLYICPESEENKTGGAIVFFRDESLQEELAHAEQKRSDEMFLWLGELKLRMREAKLMSEMMDLLHACIQVEEAFEIVSRYGRQIFPGKFGALFTTDWKRESLEMVCSWGGAPVHLEPLTPRDCWALRRGQLHYYANPQTDMICRHVNKNDNVQPYICIPLMEQGEALGIFHLQCPTGEKFTIAELPEEFKEERHQLAINMAERVGLALANTRLREKLRYQAIRDPLTGLFNRRHMEEALQRELYRAMRKNSSIGIIMIDIDYFKKYNDTYGHPAGDTLLYSLGQFLSRNTRREDVACRYGGEEFLLVIVDSSLSDTSHRAETMRQEVKMMGKEYNLPIPITISIGVAAYPQNGKEIHQLIQAADKALYHAKAAGRDKVWVADEDPYGARQAPPAKV